MYNEPLTFDVVPGNTADTRIFRLHGPITLSNLFDFQKVLMGGTEKLTILDFTESQYIDSAGLGAILNYYVSGKRHGRDYPVGGGQLPGCRAAEAHQRQHPDQEIRQCRSRGSALLSHTVPATSQISSSPHKS